MLAAYAQRGQTLAALDLFKLLNLHGQDPDEVSFLALFSACSHAGLLRDGHCYFVSITHDYGQRLTIDHYVCMIDLLCRAGRLAHAEELLHAMPFSPSSTAWTALLNGCEMHRDVERARGIPGRALGDDHGPYVLLSNTMLVS
ncbi:hypothetical protein SELMODRAFT_97032 [Selaginella moellendorffii]|uniref:Pentacotripeptide-repeat region of PRORP domain-containing protein n=2 Tax=Selaginella moellendorffii TaxID=88036 RepID=D8RND5_SELML|nr:hypothetical protein SELMODRAFT_97032 [Selaginella moellendorffii]